MLVLKREAAKWADAARAYKVFIDGAKAGVIKMAKPKNTS